MRIGELMSSPATTVVSWLPIAEAGRLLLGHGITAVCVVDEQVRLVGIVSRSDLLRHRLVRDPRAHLRPAPEDDTEPPRDRGGRHDEGHPRPATVRRRGGRGADDAGAAHPQLPVVEDGRVVGMVSITDLLRAAVRGDERIARTCAHGSRRRPDPPGRGGWTSRTESSRSAGPRRRSDAGPCACWPRRSRASCGSADPRGRSVPGAAPGAGATRTATEGAGGRPAGPPRTASCSTLDECLATAAGGHRRTARLRPARQSRRAARQPRRRRHDDRLPDDVGLQAPGARSAEAAAFEVDGFEPGTRTGWSVLVRGTVSTVYDAHEIERYEALGVAGLGRLRRRSRVGRAAARRDHRP